MDICIFIPVRITAVSQFWLIKPSHKTYPSVINKNKDCSLSANEPHSGISRFSLLNQNASLYARSFGAALPCPAVLRAGRFARWVFLALLGPEQDCGGTLLPASTPRTLLREHGHTALWAQFRVTRMESGILDMQTSDFPAYFGSMGLNHLSRQRTKFR